MMITYQVRGPEGQKEGIFTTEGDAIDYAADLTHTFATSFSVWCEEQCIITLRPAKRRVVG